MKLAKLLHNPNAGEGEYDEEQLVALIEGKGFKCEYGSMKKRDWKELSPNIDFLVITGGDGTIRKVVKKLLDRKQYEKRFPIALLAAGTANNIAKSLDLDDEPAHVVDSWKRSSIKNFDIGRIYNLPKAKFFLEGVGFGVFPSLMKKMEKAAEIPGETPDEKLSRALEILLELLQTYKAKFCTVEADGVDYSGEYLMVELMNIRSIGPNLHFAEDADPGDGVFELVLVSDDQRDHLITYVKNKLNGAETVFAVEPVKVRNIQLKWEGNTMHVDDELIKRSRHKDVSIEMHRNSLSFFVMAERGIS